MRASAADPVPASVVGISSLIKVTAIAVFALALQALFADARQGGTASCRGDVKPQVGPMGYALRRGVSGAHNRCEGLYEEEVATGLMEPVSLVQAEVPIPSKAYRLQWPRPASTQVQLRALGVTPLLPFRMDAQTFGFYFDWETDVLRELRIRSAALGLIATTEMDVPGRGRQQVYLPLVLLDRDSAPGSPALVPAVTTYLLKVSSPESLRDIVVAVSGPLADLPGAATTVRTPIEGAYYAGAGPLRVNLEMPSRPGVYEVRLSALGLENKAPTLTTFLVKHGQ